MPAIPISPLEQALLVPFVNPALEELRSRLLHVVTSSHDLNAAVRVVVQMAYETELMAALGQTIAQVPGIAEELVATRRRFLAIDEDMTNFKYLYDPALDALEELVILPSCYVRFLRAYTGAPYPKYRMCTLAVILCFAAASLGGL